jgi:PKD repeat protein
MRGTNPAGKNGIRTHQLPAVTGSGGIAPGIGTRRLTLALILGALAIAAVILLLAVSVDAQNTACAAANSPRHGTGVLEYADPCNDWVDIAGPQGVDDVRIGAWTEGNNLVTSLGMASPFNAAGVPTGVPTSTVYQNALGIGTTGAGGAPAGTCYFSIETWGTANGAGPISRAGLFPDPNCKGVSTAAGSSMSIRWANYKAPGSASAAYYCNEMDLVYPLATMGASTGTVIQYEPLFGAAGSGQYYGWIYSDANSGNWYDDSSYALIKYTVGTAGNMVPAQPVASGSAAATTVTLTLTRGTDNNSQFGFGFYVREGGTLLNGGLPYPYAPPGTTTVGVPGGFWPSGAGPYSFTLSGVSPGSHTYTITEANCRGESPAASVTLTVTNPQLTASLTSPYSHTLLAGATSIAGPTVANQNGALTCVWLSSPGTPAAAPAMSGNCAAGSFADGSSKAASGPYTVTVDVRDSRCPAAYPTACSGAAALGEATATTTMNVVNPPDVNPSIAPASFTHGLLGGPTTLSVLTITNQIGPGMMPVHALTCTWTILSTTGTGTPDLSGSTCASGKFGDGTASLGTWTMKVTVKDTRTPNTNAVPDSTIDTNTFTVQVVPAPPVAVTVTPNTYSGAWGTASFPQIFTATVSNIVNGANPPGTFPQCSWTLSPAHSGALSGSQTSCTSDTFNSGVPGSGTYTLTITVKDSRYPAPDGVATASATITVVPPANNPPTAAFTTDAPRATLGVSMAFRDASTDPNGDPIDAWAWDFGDGQTSSMASTSHVFQHAGTFPVCLVVTDVWGATGRICRQISVDYAQAAPPPPAAPPSSGGAQPPVAIAGEPQTVAEGALVQLVGSASGADPNTVAYSWTAPAGIVLSDPTKADISFTAPTLASGAPRVVTLTLVVSDGSMESQPATVDITVVNANHVPVARAAASGPAAPGDVVTLDGSASSDADGNPLTYHWTQVAGPTVDLQGADTPVATFVAPNLVGGSVSFNLDVADARSVSSSVAQVFIVAAPTTPVSFDAKEASPGTMTFQAVGAAKQYEWSFGDGTAASGASVTHVYKTPGRYAVQLRVVDNGGAVQLSSQTLTVSGSPVTTGTGPTTTATASAAGMPWAWLGASLAIAVLCAGGVLFVVRKTRS